MSNKKETDKLIDLTKSKTVKYLRYFIYSSYFLSVILLLSVITAVVANRKTPPFYSWIQGSRVESYGHFIAGLIIEQKVNMQMDATNNPLNEQEEKDFSLLVTKHGIDLKKAELTPRDKRFMLEFPSHRPFIKGKYLILSDAAAEEISLFAPTMDQLFVNFINEMHGSGLEDNIDSRPHICFFRNRASYISAIKKNSKELHNSLGYFSPVKNCIYFFSRKSSIEGLQAMASFNQRRELGKASYGPNQLNRYLSIIDREEQNYFNELDSETLCTLRHERAHQLAHMYKLHSFRGFEQRWLTEGLAQYFETETPGEPRPQKRSMLASYSHGEKLFDWPDLINSDEHTFLAKNNRLRQLAYSQSWLLVRFLMKNYKKEFFDFIRYKKDTGILDNPLSDFDKLCSYLSLTPEQFINELQNELLSLN